MKKSTAFLVTGACVLTITNNSLAMLTKASSIKQIKKMKSSYANRPWFDSPAYIEHNILFETKDVNDKTEKILDKTNINNDLLHKIIGQNEQNNNLLKENNELLRAIFMMNGRKFPFRKDKQNSHFVYPVKGTYEQDLAMYNNICKLRDKYKFDFLTLNEQLERC